MSSTLQVRRGDGQKGLILQALIGKPQNVPKNLPIFSKNL